MSYGRAVRRFNATAARVRAEVWPVTVELADESEVEIAKSPTRLERMLNEGGSGYIQRAVATFNFPASGTFIPDIGAEWQITASDTADEIGTRWKCSTLTRSTAGTEHVCVCFRLD